MSIPPRSTYSSATQGKDLWPRTLKRYRAASWNRATFELVCSIVPFALTCGLLLLALRHHQPWLFVVLLPLAAGLVVRLFMIQHDCGHGSFFPTRRANDWIGRSIGVLTLTPYDHWRRSHAAHHAKSGHLDHRGIGDVLTLTVAEFTARNRWGRVRYRLYRHPLVMFGFGPVYLFVFHNRLPFGFMSDGVRPWISTMTTNLAIAGVVAAIIWGLGLNVFLLIYLPIVLLAASAGVWLFYVQHQFERTYWARSERWSLNDAAIHGSSHYLLPSVLRWFTANIGVHHVHHLCSRVPCYRLPEVLRDFPELGRIGIVKPLQSVRGLRLTLWDERRRRLVSFADAYR